MVSRISSADLVRSWPAPSAVPTIQDAPAPDIQAGRFARPQRLNPREERASQIRGLAVSLEAHFVVCARTS
jgi:hypothetical protein